MFELIRNTSGVEVTKLHFYWSSLNRDAGFHWLNASLVISVA